MNTTTHIVLIVASILSCWSADASNLPNDLNIPKPVEVSKDNKELYESYNYFSQTFRKSSDLKASPCDDFYNYTCKNVHTTTYLLDIMARNHQQIITALKKEEGPKWYQVLKKEFDSCVKRNLDMNGLHEDGNALRRIVNELSNKVGLPFKLLKNVDHQLDPINLGHIIGALDKKFGLQLFLNYEIKGNKLVLKSPELSFPTTYFVNSFGKFEDDYKSSIKDYEGQLAMILGDDIDDESLAQIIDDVVNFENDLAHLLYNEHDDTPASFSGSELFHSSRPQAIDLSSYFHTLLKDVRQDGLRSLNDMKITITSPRRLQSFQDFLLNTKPEILWNYIHIRIARSLRKYFIRKPKECIADEWLRQGLGVSEGFMKQIPRADPFPSGIASKVEELCLSEIYWGLQGPLNRVYLDASLPKVSERKQLVKRVKILTEKVINGFRYQIDQLPWFTPSTKTAALKKLDGMLYNVVYDEWVEDDEELNKKYGKSISNENDDDFTASRKFHDAAQLAKWSSLFSKNRTENFEFPIYEPNAWYSLNSNHFFLPLGILQRPLFDINFPSSVQYGSIGYIIGHEVTHGFDANGINYNDQGDRNPWMDKESKAKFDEMTKCVIEEYNEIHGRGEKTQGEDIADNGGVRASYNAYMAEKRLYGSDPQLPGAPLNQLTQDQLFFVSFAQVWCSNQPKQDYPFDPHSPMFARIYGPLQNFPAFQAAYHCPIGSAYAPKKHCVVYG